MSVCVDKTRADDRIATINDFCDIFRLCNVVGDGDDEVISNQNVNMFGNNLVVLLVQNNSTGF
jgi:hypothetical protein